MPEGPVMLKTAFVTVVPVKSNSAWLARVVTLTLKVALDKEPISTA